MCAVKWSSLVLLAGLWFFQIPEARAVSGGEGTVSLVDGSYNYRYDFELPPGRNGMAPSLALVYSSDGGRSSVGYGWRWNIPYIARSSAYGTPLYRDSAPGFDPAKTPFDTFEYHDAQGSVCLLVPIELDGTRTWFRCVREGLFAWFGYDTSTQIWTALFKNGQRQELGNTNARSLATFVDTAKEGAKVTEIMRQGIASWYLNKQEDTAGNAVEYSYWKDPEGLIFPQTINYTKNKNRNWAEAFRVVFVYREEPEANYQTVSDCRSGQCFEHKRSTLTAVQIQLRDGPSSERFVLVNEYSLAYDQIEKERILAGITHWGLQNGNYSYLQYTRFNYEQEKAGPLASSGAPWTNKVNETLTSVYGRGDGAELTQKMVTRFIDLNGDGIKDYVSADPDRTSGNYWSINYGGVFTKDDSTSFAIGNSAQFQLPDAAAQDAQRPLRKTVTKNPKPIKPRGGQYCPSNPIFLASDSDEPFAASVNLCNPESKSAHCDCVDNQLCFCGHHRITKIYNGNYWGETGLGVDVMVVNDLVDMNGDGLPDWVEFDLEDGVFRVAYNNGQGAFVPARAPIPSPLGAGISALGTSHRTTTNRVDIGGDEEHVSDTDIVALVDLNGDSLPDIIDAREYIVQGKMPYAQVYLNVGNGFAATPIDWKFPASDYNTTGQVSSVQKHTYLDCYRNYVSHKDAKMSCERSGAGPVTTTLASLGDVNGDGLVDLVTTGYGLKVYLNTGKGFAPALPPTALPVFMDGNPTYFQIDPGYFGNKDHQIIRTRVRGLADSPRGEDTYLLWNETKKAYEYSCSRVFDDFDGDGVTDLADANGVRLRAYRPFLRLRTVDSKQGNHVTIDYVAQSGLSAKFPVGARAVVKKVTFKDAITGKEHALEYVFSGGKQNSFELAYTGSSDQPAWYLPFRTGFSGFENAAVYDSARGTWTSVTHLTDSYYRLGLPSNVKVYESRDGVNKLLRSTDYTYRKFENGVGLSTLSNSWYPKSFAPMPDSKTELVYDENSRAAGVETLYEYDSLGQLVSVIESNGVDPTPEESAAEKNLIQNSHLVDVRVPKVRFKVTSSTYKTVDRHREGIFRSAIRDVTTGDPTQTLDPQGKVEFFHDNQDNLDSITQGLLTKVRRYASADRFYDTTYAVDPTSGLTQSVQPPFEDPTSFEYDELTQSYPKTQTIGDLKEAFEWNVVWGRPTVHTDPNGQGTAWEYDPFGRLKTEIRPDGKIGVSVEYRHSDTYNIVTISTLVNQDNDGELRRRTATYHDSEDRPIGRIEEQTRDLASLSTIEYDELGRPIRVSTPQRTDWYSGVKLLASPKEMYALDYPSTRLQYDALDRRIREISWDQTAKSWQYLADRIISTDEVGHRVTVFTTWDGNLRKEVKHQNDNDGSDQVSIFSFDLNNQLVGAEGPQIPGRSNWMLYERDWLGRVTQVTVSPKIESPSADVTPKPLDKGKLGKILIKLKGWDKINPSPVIQPRVRTYSMALPSGAISAFESTGLSPSSTASFPVTSPVSAGSSSSALESFLNPEVTWKYFYDEDGQKSVRVKSPEGRETKWLYDSHGRLSMREHYRKGVLEDQNLYEYDKGDGFPRGRLASASSFTTQTNYLYDRFGRVTDERTLFSKSGQTYSMHFERYNDGGIKDVTYPSGTSYHYNRWEDGSPRSLVRQSDQKLIAGADSYNYNPAGQLLTYGNGQMDMSFGYSPEGQIQLIESRVKSTAQRKDGSSIIWRRDLKYRANGQIETAEEWIGNQVEAITYHYDQLLRLHEEVSNIRNLIYDYDLNDRFKKVTKGERVETYAYGNKSYPWAVTGISWTGGETKISVNNDGMVGGITEAGATQAFEFDARGMVHAISEANGGESVDYDPFDRIAHRVDVKAGTETDFVNSWFEKETKSNTSRSYLYFAGKRIAIEENGRLHYFHSDQSDSIRVVTDENGEEESAQVTSAYGEVLSQKGASRSGFSFQGNTSAVGKSLWQFSARTYNPRLRQWMSMDPMVLRQPLIHLLDGTNPFRFVKNDPVNRIDPSGLQSCPNGEPLCISNEPDPESPPGQGPWRPEEEQKEPFGPIPSPGGGIADGPPFRHPEVEGGSGIVLKPTSPRIRDILTNVGVSTYHFFLDTKNRIEMGARSLGITQALQKAADRSAGIATGYFGPLSLFTRPYYGNKDQFYKGQIDGAIAGLATDAFIIKFGGGLGAGGLALAPATAGASTVATAAGGGLILVGGALAAGHTIVGEDAKAKLQEMQRNASTDPTSSSMSSTLSSSRVSDPIRRHHAWAKYLGGAEKQDLVPLPKSLHDAYHSGLDKILPRQKGTAFYNNLTGATRQQMYRDLADYTKAFDLKYKTRIFEAMIKEGFPVP